MLASAAALAAPRPLEADPQAVEAAAFVLALRARGIRDTAVLGAMERVPRELFAPTRFADLSRSDVSLPLPCGQTMTTPGVIAPMLVALGAGPGERVYEVGTGSGYVTALLARLACRITSVERYATLAESAAARLRLAGLSEPVTLAVGDGLAPPPQPGCFERILLNGAVAALPEAVTSLLAPGGRLVGALAGEGGPRLVVLQRREDGALSQELGPALRIGALAAGDAAYL